MTVVVTGGTGFVGGNLVRALLADGERVRVLAHGSRDAIEGLDVEELPGDVRDPESLRRTFEGAEVVYHLAGLISLMGDLGGRVTATNVEGVAHAAEAALGQGVRRFVHVSSIHAYDLSGPAPLLDEDGPRAGPHHPAYDRSKRAGELALQEVIERGLDAVIVNPTGIVGPYEFGPSRMGRLLLDLQASRLPALVRGSFDFVDVRDVVAGVRAAADRGRTGANYILCGHWASAAELAALAAEVTGVAAPRFVVPMGLARAVAPVMDGLGWLFRFEPRFNSEALLALRAVSRPSCMRAAQELGYSPRPLRETITAAYAWFEEAGALA